MAIPNIRIQITDPTLIDDAVDNFRRTIGEMIASGQMVQAFAFAETTNGHVIACVIQLIPAENLNKAGVNMVSIVAEVSKEVQ